MPLTLVTGPANAAKAGEVLGGLRGRLDDEPILVVPAFQDVEHAQRELADRGAVFGVSVLRFDRLFREIGRRSGHTEWVASEVQRELIVEGAVRRAQLELLAASAGHRGFVRAAARFVAEVGRSGRDALQPGRFTRALRDWADDGPRRRYAEEVAAVYRGYRDGLEAAGLADAESFAWHADDALRREPSSWGQTPLFVYGFDDFNPLQLDALETIANHCGADVCVSLPYERGRAAFKTVANVHQNLLGLGAREQVLPPLDDHYAPESRAALHHVERSLFEDDATAVEAGGAIAFHSAAGQRAEIELAGARVLDLLRGGVEAGDIAVVLRRPGDYASLLEQVFGAYDIPFSIDRSLGLEHSGLGRGLIALVRCAAAADATAGDLLAWLRTPGLLKKPVLADRLEASVRREGAHSAAEARALWEREHWKLDDLDRLRQARAGVDFLTELERQLGRLFAGPYRRQAAILRGPELDDPRVYAAAREALAELRAVLEADPRTRLGPERVLALLHELRVHLGEPPQPDRVQVAEPEAIRARRFEAVFVCGLQEGEFPKGTLPEPFLPDEDRRAIARASGLRLPIREDRLDRERYLLYVCCSRAERLLVLSSRSSDEEGNPQPESFFVEDVRDLLAPGAAESTRSLSDVTWRAEDAPTAGELERALAAAGPRRVELPPSRLTAEPLLKRLATRDAVSAGALENFADCPVKWLVKNILRPNELVPDPEQMVRGRYAHSVLQRTFERLRGESGSRRVTQANLAQAERLLAEELRSQRSDFQLSPKQTRVKAAARRLEFDLLRFLRREAERDGSFEPAYLELPFGDGDTSPPVEIEPGLKVRGRIDRVDTSDGMALVIDYKSGKRVDSYKVGSWEAENRFQAALYMLVVERLLELRAAGGVYVPLGSTDSPRGMVAQGVEELGAGYKRTDVLPPDEFRAKLDWALGQVRRTDARMRGGELGCDPDQCAWNGGCSYPSICRCEA
ncbi:MAG: exodeoxyribonuclease V subunit gamma [Thermoleophilaceae bacterium]|nr:exodeoxyribonuclease V subunit gamma [Thermoleophilaceae bacterium]